MTQPKSRLIARLVFGLSFLMASSVFAQQREGQPEDDASVAPSAQAASNLMLAATTIKTETQILSLGFSPLAAFAPTAFVCPSTQGGLPHSSRGRFLERQRVHCC